MCDFRDIPTRPFIPLSVIWKFVVLSVKISQVRPTMKWR